MSTSTSPAVFEAVIPLSGLSFNSLSVSTYGINLLTGLGITTTDATTMWNSINNFLGNATAGFYAKIGIIPTAGQLIYATNLMVLLLVKFYVFYQGTFQ